MQAIEFRTYFFPDDDPDLAGTRRQEYECCNADTAIDPQWILTHRYEYVNSDRPDLRLAVCSYQLEHDLIPLKFTTQGILTLYIDPESGEPQHHWGSSYNGNKNWRQGHPSTNARPVALLAFHPIDGIGPSVSVVLLDSRPALVAA